MAGSAAIAGLSRRQYVALRRRYTKVDLADMIKRMSEADPALAKAAPRGQSGINWDQVPGQPPNSSRQRFY